MPQFNPPRPRAATCEDCDEATGSILPGTRTSANVAVKKAPPELSTGASYEKRRRDGSDSGYSSKAGTIDSDLSGSRRMTGPTIQRGIMERERQPYAVSQTRPEAHRQSSSRPQDPPGERQPPKPKKHRHEKGECGVCDHYGWHVDLSKDLPRPTAKASVPPSPQKAQPPLPATTADELAIPVTTRKLSGNRGARPITMYGMPTTFQYQNMPLQGPVVYAPLPQTPQGWTTPLTPTIPYSPSYQYPVAIAPPQLTYIEQVPASYEYYEPVSRPVPEIRPPNPHRRSSSHSQYGQPVIRQASAENLSRPVEKISSHDSRSDTKSRKSNQSEKYDRTMPPPPRPEVVTRRPSLRKSTTHTPTAATSNHRSLNDQIPNMPPLSTSHERRISPSRPPSSYRDPQRPHLPQKSRSDSTSSHATKIGSSERVTTKTTTPTFHTAQPSSLPRERHEDEAEAYQSDRKRLTSNDLMAEVMRKNVLPKRDVFEHSETSSSKSHKSQRSGSRASSGGNGNAKTYLKVGNVNITTDGDVTMDKDGNININTRGVKSRDDGSVQGEQKRIEYVPSVSGRTGPMSAHSENMVSSAKARDRVLPGVNWGLGRVGYPAHPAQDECAVVDELPECEEYQGRGQGYGPEEFERRPASDRGARTKDSGLSGTRNRATSIAGRGSMNQARRRGSHWDEGEPLG